MTTLLHFEEIIFLKSECERMAVELTEWKERDEISEAEIQYGLARIDKLEAALRTIVAWDSFPPATTHDGKPCSYGFAWGSNGERDYMRNIAQFALNPAPSTKETSVDGAWTCEGCGLEQTSQMQRHTGDCPRALVRATAKKIKGDAT